MDEELHLISYLDVITDVFAVQKGYDNVDAIIFA